MEHTGPVDDDSADNLPPVSSQSYSDQLDGVQVSRGAPERRQCGHPIWELGVTNHGNFHTDSIYGYILTRIGVVS